MVPLAALTCSPLIEISLPVPESISMNFFTVTVSLFACVTSNSILLGEGAKWMIPLASIIALLVMNRQKKKNIV